MEPNWVSKEFIKGLEGRTLSSGHAIDRDEAIRLAGIANGDEGTLEVLFDAANAIRKAFCGDRFNLCTIANAKSGQCSEDCQYCAQSAHFKTAAPVHGLIAKESALSAAQANEAEGAHRFSLVTSGRGLLGNEEELERLVETYRHIAEHTGRLELCASHGICAKEALVRIRDAGVKFYHHNLESSRRFYPNICTSHTYDDRINTIKLAQEVGLDVCSGGIFGLGETILDRIDMALELKDLGIRSIPINLLTPIPGTPLARREPLDPREILKTVAIYRFLLPQAHIRYGAGRVKLGDYAQKGFQAGVNAALTGNFLTTTGTTIQIDKEIIKAIGYRLD